MVHQDLLNDLDSAEVHSTNQVGKQFTTPPGTFWIPWGVNLRAMIQTLKYLARATIYKHGKHECVTCANRCQRETTRRITTETLLGAKITAAR